MYLKLKTLKGFSLVEVMIAVFVLAIGLLGIAGLQITSIKSNHTALLHTQVTQLASDLSDRMRANISGTRAGNYLKTLPPAVPPAVHYTPTETYNCFNNFTGTASAGSCTPSEMALADLDELFSLAANTLPFVSAAISCTSPSGVTVTVDTAANDCSAGFTHTITMTWQEHDGAQGLVNRSTSIEFQP